MHRSFTLAGLLLCSLVFAGRLAAQPGTARGALAGATAGPGDAKAAKVYAKALKDVEAHNYGLALDDFRKADTLDGGHCLGCEMQAYKAAKQLQDYKAAQDEATLLVSHAATVDDKVEAHRLAGEACLADGGYRIFEKPFQAADAEFQAALQLMPQQPDCVYDDGVALAHLHQYEKAKAQFEQFMKLVSPKDLLYARAKLFAAQPELARKRTAPNFHVVALDGKTVSMESLVGKVVLIDFWATWCGPCKQALPHLKEIAHTFEGQPLVVISISLDEDDAAWKKFVAENGMTWIQYRDGGFDGEIATQFAVKAIPTTFTIDADGFVQDQQVGDGEIELKLKKLIAQAQEAASKKTVAEVR